MNPLQAIIALVVASIALGSDDRARLRRRLSERHVGSSFVRALEYKHRLRVCNAYPYAAPLDVYRGSSEKLTSSPMNYKDCQDFSSQLKPGDKIEFRVGEANAGTFSVSDLPQNDAVMLLVIFRHDTLSTAVSFESHVFANLVNSQIAVIDTYKGSEQGRMMIRDTSSAKTSREEDLRYDSVVAVNPGTYQCVLANDKGKIASQGLVALSRESYVVLRVGVEAKAGQAYPQDLVVYPQSDPSLLKSAAARTGVFAALMSALLASCLSSIC